jgi:hypothetical protein
MYPETSAGVATHHYEALLVAHLAGHPEGDHYG